MPINNLQYSGKNSGITCSSGDWVCANHLMKMYDILRLKQIISFWIKYTILLIYFDYLINIQQSLAMYIEEISYKLWVILATCSG